MDLVATTCVLRIQIFESTFLLLQTGTAKTIYKYATIPN